MKWLEFNSFRAASVSVIAIILAFMVGWLPAYEGLGDAGRWSLAIITLAACLWIFEAIPAFAVALLVIGLQIMVFGKPGGVLAAPDDFKAWEAFVRPWASPTMWLFFAGLLLARAAQRIRLDVQVAGAVLRASRGRVAVLLPALMLLGYVFSMFMSNTATAAMMVAALGPLLAVLPKDSPAPRSLLLGIACSANLGGMATIIGTPPNAIAAALLENSNPVTFMEWVVVGLPVSLLFVVLVWCILAFQARGHRERLEIPELRTDPESTGHVRAWQRHLTMVIIAGTIIMWMTGALHGIPTGVVSFVPIVALSVIGVIRRVDIHAIDWDVLILLAGGLSLGVGIELSGLAAWLATKIQATSFSPIITAMMLTWLAAFISNLMSNTAAANILLPITLVIASAVGTGQYGTFYAMSVALGCSVAMALPISTPPNAIVFGSGLLRTRDYLLPGLLLLFLGPPLIVLWAWFMT